MFVPKILFREFTDFNNFLGKKNQSGGPYVRTRYIDKYLWSALGWKKISALNIVDSDSIEPHFSAILKEELFSLY